MSRAAWVERDVRLPRLSLHLRELPGRGPPLVLLHGLSVDGTVWQAVGRRLHPAFSLLAPDLRGHGSSDHPARGYSAADYAADVAELLDWLAHEAGPPLLLGHSLGALAALGAAALRPDGLGRLILEDPPLSGPGPLAPYLRAVLQAKRAAPPTLLAVVRQFQPELGELLAGVQARMWERVAEGAIEAVLAHPEAVFATGDWLARVQAPTLLLQADPALDARLTPPAAEAALARLRRGTLVRFPGTGHVIHAARLAEFCRVVAEFLAS